LKNKACRPRGLCFGCSQKKSVRKKHPTSGSKYGSRGLGNWERKGRMAIRPLCPTVAPPGSLAKMIVMRLRLLRGETLDHPGDNREQVRELVDPFNGLSRKWRSGTPTGLPGD